MKPATQASACSARTSPFRYSTNVKSPPLAGYETPGKEAPLGSGVASEATIHTTSSSTTATASAPSVHGASTRAGSRRQRASARRVSAQPWTSASSSAFIIAQGPSEKIQPGEDRRESSRAPHESRREYERIY